ncbi:protein Gawky [Cimex lectularius]|uniref:UBA domain-containing protein n=1 Tax=Cimex lectularius TaxID=79782 RepID=A0A8I6R933_CIMLE|nr:protein Gawky [Cimex lectularius]XP_014240800.1 protein Gawky [Cimex lectularius]XP_014240801.1 protein Gawky [Cimex lectularius]
MFPNQSSSDEISSKINAFVQINDEDRDGDVIGVAQPHISICPSFQVPEKRDKMVVVIGESGVGEHPSLTVIACHPSQAPAKVPCAISKSESDGSSMMLGAERKQTGALCFDSIKSSSNSNNNINNNDSEVSCKVLNNLIDKKTKQSSTLQNIPQTNDYAEFPSFKICDYYSRWGIPRCFKLLGGGESALTGTDGWGTPPTSQSGTTGWTSGSTGQQSTQGSQQGGGNNNNNNNSRQGQSGSGVVQQAQGGPPSQTQVPATTTAPNSTSANVNTSTSTNSNSSSGNSSSTAANQQTAVSQNGTTGQSGTQTGTGGNTGSTSWAAATAGKGGLPSQQTTPTSNPSNSSNSTKQQMEQLNTMREALFSQDGWGGQNVNQDIVWDIPGSPEPGNKENNNAAAVPIWKLPINNGTDLWEANLRNGGIPPPQNQAQKTAWGHTPSSNIGGTWGEDDEMDTSNFWTGVPAAGTAPQWPNQPPQIWPAGTAKKEGEWGGPNWNDQRGDPRDIRHGEMRQMIDTRENMRPGNMDNRSIGNNDVLMRGDHRGGITGRLNGVPNDAMWPTGPGPHHHIPHHQTKLPNHPSQPGVNQWSGGGGPPIKEMSLGGKSGWEEPSPPAQRRNMPNYDDGTSLWGQQHSRPTLPGQNKVSHWKEMPATGIGRGLQCPPGRGNPNMKPDQPIIWPHHPRNGGWGEGGIDVNAGPWADDKPAPWMDQTLTPSSWQSGPKHKPSWDGEIDPSSSWVGHTTKPPSKTISKEMIWGSKQYRMLTDMGFKKEDVENALRASGLVLEDALEQLNATRNERWRHSDLDPEHPIINYPSPQPTICIPFQANGGGGGSASGGAGGNVLNNSNPSLATISPAIMQKLLSQQPPPQQQPPFTQQSSRTQQTQQPTAQQLRMLVQQIQMAVQNGYLTPQILSQPLAPQTLILLNQLLQQIKNLQQLMQHHTVILNPLNKPTSSNQLLQITVQITKTKQQIGNLQNQIAAQQAIYVKHQQQTPQSSEFFKTPIHETMSSTLHSNFSDLTLKDPQSGTTGQQSRLNQWKLPALDKDSEMGTGNEFSRAPGSTAKPAPGNSSPNINPLLGQPDGTWSSVNRTNCDTGWPDSGGDDNSSKDWPTTTQSSQSFSDLVPEFEPGKPWKGNPLKSIEDDPSMTPGSVARPPLSIPPIKDSHILSSSSSVTGKASPTTSSSIEIMPQIPSLSLSSSTWSFNPPVSSTSDMFDSGLSKLSGGKGTVSAGVTSSGSAGSSGTTSWGESGTGSSVQTSSSSELWATPKPRGPPPGLPAKPQSQGSQGAPSQPSGSSGQASNGWLSSRWGGPQASWPQPAGGSTWLLLRNLTPQIDGSTLKTLCLQHGPLQSFHLYLNHGIALAKYSSREEASKAQGALNNCVLGNTTIFAESPSESDVLSLLQHLGHSTGQQSGNGGAAWRPTKESWPGTSNSQLWGGTSSGSGSTTASLWGDSSDQHRTTPSSINSFLPGDLLGSESI